MSRTKKTIVVGAGLVGSLLGVMLGRRGYVVDLYERRSDPRGANDDSGRSINLALSSRGITALTRAGLMDEVQPLLIPMRGRMLHQADGTTHFSPYGQREHEVIYSVPRGRLNELMVDEAVKATDVNVAFDQTCGGIDFANRAARFQSTTDETFHSAPFDLIIGSDGAGSKVRRELMEANGGESESYFLDHVYKELEIPATPGGEYAIEREALHIWPRSDFMLIALPNPDGSFTVTLFIRPDGNQGIDSLDSPEKVRAFFTQHFSDAVPLMPDLEIDFFANPAGRLGTLRCGPWHYEDCGLIVGDAAHAIVPFHGQGMNAGFEDCTVLMKLLDEHNDDWSQVLPEFTRTRKPDADAIADMAIENHQTMQHGVIAPKFHLKKTVGFELEKRFPDLFIPRYSRVMFHDTPYAEAFRIGVIQDELLDRLTRDANSIDDIDFELAETLIAQLRRSETPR